MLERVKTLIRQHFQYFVLFLKSFTFVLLVVENVCILTNFLKNVVISMLSSNYRCVFLRSRAWNRWSYAFPDIFIADLISPETSLLSQPAISACYHRPCDIDWLPTLLVLWWRLSCRLVLIYCYFFHNIIIVNDIIIIIVLLVFMKYFTSHFISFILFSFVKILIMKFFYIWHGTIFITFERFSFVKFLRM